jgi:hypothetical protein
VLLAVSEQNILNPTPQSVMNPHYSIPHKDPQIDVSWQARSGQEYDRDMLVRGMEWQLHWEKVPFSTYQSLRQWFRQYRKGFFSYFDIDDNRYYSGKFLAEPQFERVGNNQVNVSATFVEIPKVPLFQYPSNWGVDSIFLEERGDYGQDLVKLTGTWDHRDKNYFLWSEQFDNAAWLKDGGSTVTPNTIVDPLGVGLTADVFTKGSGTFALAANLEQLVVPIAPIGGAKMTFSVWLKIASGTRSISLAISDNVTYQAQTAFMVTNAWQRFSVTSATNFANTGVVLGGITDTGGAGSQVHVWGAQLEYASAPTTYTQTTNAALTLLAPAPDATLHGNGFAYFNAGTGTFISDFAEWMYVGYGFRVWAPSGPGMGLLPIALDGVVLNSVDLYSAAQSASSVVFTKQNVPLGQHRIKIGALNQKNAASSGFVIAADAIEVMR